MVWYGMHVYGVIWLLSINFCCRSNEFWTFLNQQRWVKMTLSFVVFIIITSDPEIFWPSWSIYCIYCGTIAFSMQYSHLFTIFFCWASSFHRIIVVCVFLQKQNKNSCNCQSFYHFFSVRLSWETMRFFLNESKDISIGWVMNYSKNEGKKTMGKNVFGHRLTRIAKHGPN